MRNFHHKLILLALILFPLIAYTQTPVPGGVQSPEFWITTFFDSDKNLKWGDIKNFRLSSLNKFDTLNINFHPSKKFNGNEAITLHNTKLEQKTFVGGFYPEYNNVYVSSDIYFRANFGLGEIFKFSNPAATIAKANLTSSMKVGTYSFSRIPKSNPNPWGEEKETTLNFEFNGFIPELLVYDRVLKREELSRVHSYFAIKYGITIEMDYFDSSGDTIWNYNKNKKFHHRIAAIGRDSSGAISQPVSTTTYEDFYLEKHSYYYNANKIFRSVTIGFDFLEYKKVNDKTFLFWGDNDLAFQKKPIKSLYKTNFDEVWISQRKWMIQNLSPQPLTTYVKLGNPLKAELDRSVIKPTYYLILVNDDVIELNDIRPFNIDTLKSKSEEDNILSQIVWNAKVNTEFTFAVGEKLRFKSKRANRSIVKNRKRCSGEDFAELDELVLPKSLKYKSGYYYHRGDKFFKSCIYRINYGFDGQNLTFYCEGGIGDTLKFQLSDIHNMEIKSGSIARRTSDNTPYIIELKIPVNNLKGDYFLLITDETGQVDRLPILIK
ncbi:MAG TPA: hypothetical protein PLJ60_11705 [Chryseolinea sp.]|nr:hypothetical protein [Chryseolinea sp.]